MRQTGEGSFEISRFALRQALCASKETVKVAGKQEEGGRAIQAGTEHREK